MLPVDVDTMPVQRRDHGPPRPQTGRPQQVQPNHGTGLGASHAHQTVKDLDRLRQLSHQHPPPAHAAAPTGEPGESRKPGSGRGRAETESQPETPRRAAYFTPSLLTSLKKLPWASVPASSQRSERDHGRRATRTIKVIKAPAWIAFTSATQVAQVRRTVTRRGKKSVEVLYLITSATHHHPPPQVLAAWIQGHWAIENNLHWVRDVTYDEDRSQVRTGNAPRVMATLRKR